jgi:NAD(P)-dependent dehydrogenase (short-subunit alcohol dehydrogenase family)
VVNNVGGLDARTGFLDVTDDQWQAMFDLNFHSAVWMSRAALPALLNHGGARSTAHCASVRSARPVAATLVTRSPVS